RRLRLRMGCAGPGPARSRLVQPVFRVPARTRPGGGLLATGRRGVRCGRSPRLAVLARGSALAAAWPADGWPLLLLRTDDGGGGEKLGPGLGEGCERAGHHGPTRRYQQADRAITW